MEIEHSAVDSVLNQDDPHGLLDRILKNDMKTANEDEVKKAESEILMLASKLSKTGKSKELANLIRYIRPFLSNISKAKAAKIVQTLVEKFLEMNTTSGLEVDLCKECIDWAKEEKRIFLRQALEAKLLSVYYELKDFDNALAISGPLLKELKKMDDKNLLVDVQLIESKIYHALGNLPKSRASLTSARTTANSIYCSPRVQGSLDLQSGIVHASEGKDFNTAYSYFYEAFEAFETCGPDYRVRTISALKYTLLSKVMLNNPEEVESLIIGKLALKYGGKDLEALKAIAGANKNRSLSLFQQARETYRSELMDDPIIKMLLETLYDKLLEQNLLRIIEPYSRIQIHYVAESIKLPLDVVEKKLSQMILDQKFNGIIDQSDGGILIVFEEETPNRTFDTSINIIECMSKVMDTLYIKSKKLS
ncbi:unnamed protein product [Gordionus sp. m RMFG-2023]